MVAHAVTFADKHDGVAVHHPTGILVEISGGGYLCQFAVGHIDHGDIAVWIVGGFDIVDCYPAAVRRPVGLESLGASGKCRAIGELFYFL